MENRKGLFERLYNDHNVLVRRIIASIIQRPDDVDDVAQDVWLTIYRIMTSERGITEMIDCNWLAYTRKTAERVAKHTRQKYASEPVSLDMLLEKSGDGVMYDSVTMKDINCVTNMAAPEAEPEVEDVVQQDTRELAAVRSLPPKARQVVILKYRHDKTNREISEAMGISEATVRYHLMFARKTLKGLLVGWGIEGAA